MEREGSEARTEQREGHREGGRIRWGRVLVYATFLLLIAFAWYLFSTFVFEFVEGAVASGSVGQWALLAWSTVAIVVTIAYQVAAYAVLAYRTPERPLVHVLLVALILWLISVALPGNTFLEWLAGGLFGALWALVGFGAGASLGALRSGDGAPLRAGGGPCHGEKETRRGG